MSPVRRLSAVLVVVVVVALVGLGLTQDRSPQSPAETTVSYDRDSGELAFRLERFDGGFIDSTDLAGRPIVLNGYASWCTVCIREMPDFERVHQAAGSSVAFVGFNPQSNDRDAAQARLVDQTGITYPTVRDPEDRLLREFNPTGGLPVTVFIDEDGVVRKVHRGLLTEKLLLEELRRTLGVEV